MNNTENTAIFFGLLAPGRGWRTASLQGYVEHARLWVRSLRRRGYVGDIWCIHQAGFTPVFDEAFDVRLSVMDWQPNAVETQNVFWKLHASEFFPADKYRAVLGADVDLVCFGDLSPLFDLPGEFSAMYSFRRKMRHPELMGGLFSDAELDCMGDMPGVNCGVYSCAGAALAEIENTILEYHEYPDSPKWRPGAIKTEQHAFNCAVWRGALDFMPYHGRHVHVPKPQYFADREFPPVDLKILHLAGKKNNKPWVKAKVRDWEARF